MIPNRRTILTALGIGLATTACGTNRPTVATPACVLTPESTEGPYYVDTAPVRTDIRDNRPGVPLTLRITILDATTCTPLPTATVDIWHADAHGTYSGITDTGKFLRGAQPTDPTGTATFTTIFPGWYDNRTVHIHVKVRLATREIHTGQLYFDDEITQTIATVAPYADRAEPRTRNTEDFLFRRGNALVPTSGNTTTGYRAEIILGVQR
ncbi:MULTISPECIES: intradiol ring-cleavage dioxygenase [unclassified Nocardia]|uniref:intradiol ring-cleavage dioxygenase n=1 Tax=unclassified Nocardia TaxID=2637762 RepID=UPI00278C5205|nr:MULTISPECIES: intradiol ring-cleavage dioxygenase [unclassified Nocardia]